MSKSSKQAQAHSKQGSHKNIPAPASKPLSIVYPHAAGLDIGKDEIFVAVPPDRDPQPVRAYPTFTPDLIALADWLQACQIGTVAMESTGVYWIPIYELLEARGINCFLVNAAHLKRVPGRKSDVQDCQWLQQCHSFGLLAGSFRPDSEMLQLRTYLRHRAELIERRSPHVLHMQKVRNRAAQAFRLAASSASHSNSALGAFYRRLRARIGPAQAMVATAHKIARIFYYMLRDKRPYEHISAQRYEEQFRAREVKNLQRKAAQLGFTLTPQAA